MTKYELKLCDKCPNTYQHSEHQRCNGCRAKVPIPLELKAFTNSTSYCNKCPDDSDSGRMRDGIYGTYYKNNKL